MHAHKSYSLVKTSYPILSCESILIPAGILDGIFCHTDSLSPDVWQHVMTLVQQMLECQQGRAAGLHLAAVVGVGRLLLYASHVCADLGQTEQLVALLVQSYVQPDCSARSRLLAILYATCLVQWSVHIFAGHDICLVIIVDHV